MILFACHRESFNLLERSYSAAQNNRFAAWDNRKGITLFTEAQVLSALCQPEIKCDRLRC